MTTLNIQGIGSVNVGDEFLKLSHEDQNKTVEEIVAHIKASNVAKDMNEKSSGILSQAADFIKSIPGGIVGGLASTASRSGQAAQIEMGQTVNVPEPGQAKGIVEREVTGSLHKPTTLGGRIGEGIGEAIGTPTSYIGPGLGRTLAGSILSGVAGESAGAATAGTKAEPYARMAASFIGGFPFGRWRTAAAKLESPAPLAQELYDAGREQYKAIRGLDLRLNPAPIRDLMTKVESELTGDGLTRTNVPETYAVIDRLTKGAPKGAFVSATDFDSARQELLQASRSVQNPREAVSAWRAIGELDKFLSDIPESSVIRGDAKTASELFSQARGNWAAAKRVEMLSGKLQLGELNAATAHSGMNTDNAIRQAVKQLIRPNKYGKTLAEQHGFSPDEIKGMNQIARGTATVNTIRYIGNLLGGGGGFGQLAVAGASAAAGYETGHPELMGLGLLGIGARRLAGRLTERQAERLVESVGLRSPAGRDIRRITGAKSARAGTLGSSLLRSLSLGQ